MNILPVVPVLNASIDVKELLGTNPLRVFEGCSATQNTISLCCLVSGHSKS